MARGRVVSLIVYPRVQLNKDKEAMSDVQISLILKPNSFKALRTRARLHLRDEDFGSAIRDLAEAILHTAEQRVRNELQAELRDAEFALEKFRSRKQTHYEVLGAALLLD